MSIITSIATSFKQGMLAKTYDITSDSFKMALYDSSAALSAATTAYTALHECSGTGYTAGGIALTGAAITTNGSTVGITFDDPTFTSVTLPDVRGYMIYDHTVADGCVTVFDFGQSFSFTAQSAEIFLPTPGVQSGTVFFL